MAHDDALHKQAVERGDYADETLYDHDSLTASLIHFADGSHAVRLDLPDRGLSLVIDTPAWLDLDTVLFEVTQTNRPSAAALSPSSARTRPARPASASPSRAATSSGESA